MTVEIRVPTLGESVTEATIAQWFKKPGDAVAADEPLVELETDKVTVEVPAPAAGVLSEFRCRTARPLRSVRCSAPSPKERLRAAAKAAKAAHREAAPEAAPDRPRLPIRPCLRPCASWSMKTILIQADCRHRQGWTDSEGRRSGSA